MSKKLNLSLSQSDVPAFKPEPVIFLEKTPFDETRPDYDIEVTERTGVVVYSECCADIMSRETAEKTRDAITAWLEATK